MTDKTRAARPTFGHPARKRKKNSWLEDRVAAFIGREALPQPIREFRFAPPRFFRFDFAWPSLGIALEAEGGIWTSGRHSRGAGMADDCEKYNLAHLQGWRVFRYTERQLRDGTAFALVRDILTTQIRYVPSVLTPEIEVGDSDEP